MSSNLGEEIYSDSASFGRIMTYIYSVILTGISLLLIYVGVKILKTPQTYTGKTSAKVNTVDCTKNIVNSSNGSSTTYNCSISVTYKVNDVDYTTSLQDASSYEIKTGDSVNIEYNPTNPADSRISQISSKTLGWGAIILGVIILLGTIVHVYLVRRYKFFAAGTGVADVYHLL